MGPRFWMGALLLVLGAGCDWRSFDKLADQAPVVSVKPPGNFGPTGDFGQVLLPIAAPSDVATVAGRYLVSGLTGTGLALVELDAAGHAKTRTVTSPELDDLASSPIVSLAEIPGVAGGAVLMGAPRQGTGIGGEVLVLTLAGDFTVAPFAAAEQVDLDFGIGVAAGNLVGAAGADYVVLTDDTLRVYPDGATTSPLSLAATTACPITLSAALPAPERQSRPVVIANWGAGPQIAVGTPAASGGGAVSIFSVAATGVTCAFTLTHAESRFGQSVTAGDFDGDGVTDLLVGAPPESAYVFFGPLSAASTGVRLAPTEMVVATGTDGGGAGGGGAGGGVDGGGDAHPAADAGPFDGGPAGGVDAAPAAPVAGVEFGASVAAVNIDGLAGDEAVVGDPGATVAGQTVAGQVTIFALSSARAPTARAQVNDRYPATNESYGATVGPLRFCPPPSGCSATDTRRLLQVGGAAETFTVFKLFASESDPRTP